LVGKLTLARKPLFRLKKNKLKVCFVWTISVGVFCWGAFIQEVLVKTKTRPPSAPKRRSKIASNQKRADELKHSFDSISNLVDGAVTGGILGGIPAATFLPILSYWFMHSASQTRGKTKEDFDKWTTDLDIAWDPLITAIENFADEFDGLVEELGEEEELEFLRPRSGEEYFDLSEFEQRRFQKKASELLEWLMDTISADEEALSLIIEMSLIVTYFKVAALCHDVEDQVYQIVRQYTPLIVQVYDGVLEKA
jgi:hypothetical protein